jgi:hypothetical protein
MKGFICLMNLELRIYKGICLINPRLSICEGNCLINFELRFYKGICIINFRDQDLYQADIGRKESLTHIGGSGANVGH